MEAEAAVLVRLSSLRAEVLKDLKHTRQLLRSYNRLIINPRTAKWIQWWDAASFVALLFTATVTPYEVCVGLPARLDALYVANSIVNLVFILDILVQFFLPVPDPKAGDNLTLIRSHWGLARRYLRGCVFCSRSTDPWAEARYSCSPACCVALPVPRS